MVNMSRKYAIQKILRLRDGEEFHNQSGYWARRGDKIGFMLNVYGEYILTKKLDMRTPLVQLFGELKQDGYLV